MVDYTLVGDTDEKRDLNLTEKINEISNISINKIDTKIKDVYFDYKNINSDTYIYKTEDTNEIKYKEEEDIDIDDGLDDVDGVDKDDGVDISYEKYLCKKSFFDVATKFVSSDKIYTDDKDKQIYVLRFQYLVNTLFIKTIDKYKDWS